MGQKPKQPKVEAAWDEKIFRVALTVDGKFQESFAPYLSAKFVEQRIRETRCRHLAIQSMRKPVMLKQ